MDKDFIKLNFVDGFIKSNSKLRLVLSGLLSPFDLFLIKSIASLGKKILYITIDEQTALKAQKDLETLLNIKSEVLPNQEIGLYSELEKNYYIYQEQINIFLNQPNVIFAPIKALSEKFGTIDFYKNNIIEFKKNDTVDYTEITKKLVELGYKRTTNVVDIGEFALRGDILDIHGLDYNPIRIEFFADTIEDIRYFNPNTQKSFKKVENARILPLYKFILNDKNKAQFIEKIKKIKNNDDFTTQIKNELMEKIQERGYFEGIEYYINYIEEKTNSALDFFSDYILIFKETSQIISKYQNIDEKYIQEYDEAIKSNLKLPLEKLNHVKTDEFLAQTKKFKSIGLDNFLEDDYDKIIEFDLSLPPVFSCDIEKIGKFIKKYLNENYKILICTNFPNRLKEVFDELEIFSFDIFSSSDITPPVDISG